MTNLLLKTVTAAAFFLGILVSPDLVATYLTSDGELGATNFARLTLIRAACVVGAVFAWVQLQRHDGWRGVVRHFAQQSAQWPTYLFRVVCLLAVAYYLAFAVYSGNGTNGGEYLNIARSLAAGEGFAVLEANRWMWFDFVQDPATLPQDVYYPTVMAEPIYPFLLSLSISLMGAEQFTPVLWLHTFAWVGSAMLWFSILKRVLANHWIAAGAASLLLLWPSAINLHLAFLSPAPLAGLFVATLAWLAMTLLEDSRLKWALIAGLVVGFGALTLATLMAVIPVLCLVPLLRDVKSRASWAQAFVIGLVAVTVIAPWSYRNYQVVDAFVPVRVGMGLISHQGNPVLAATFFDNRQACSDGVGEDLWQTSGPRESIRIMGKKFEHSRAIYRVSFACVEEHAPADYAQMNEQQRDAFYAQEARTFIQENPGVFAWLGLHKYLKFFEGWHWQHTVVGVFALAGLFAGLFNKNLFVLLMMLGVFVGPYVLGAPWGYRYRFPVEGLMLLFASLPVHWLVEYVRQRLGARSAKAAEPGDRWSSPLVER